MANCSAKTEQNSRTLINSPGIRWKQWPQQQTTINGIYVIKQNGLVIYVGRSKDIKQRLKSHCSGQQQAIDRHIHAIGATAALMLSYNYVPDPYHECAEHCYLKYITKLLDHRPEFNMQRGDACSKAKNNPRKDQPCDKDTACAIL